MLILFTILTATPVLQFIGALASTVVGLWNVYRLIRWILRRFRK